MTGKSRTSFLPILSFLSAAILLFLRKPQAFLHAQFWAEDAVVFFRENILFGAGALLKTYAGYFHFLPRVAALAGSALPYEWIPLYYNLSALLLFAVFGLWFLGPRLEVKRAFLLPFASALVPHSGECFVCLTNLQWMLAPYLILFCFRRPPENKIELMQDVFVVLCAGLTGPFILFCLPFFLRRALKTQSVLLKVWTGAACAVALIQAAAIVLNSDSAKSGVVPVLQGLSTCFSVIFKRAGSFLAPFYASDAGAAAAGSILAAGLVFLLAGLIWKSKNRFFYSALVGCALLELAAAFWKYYDRAAVLSVIGNGDRYFYFAYVLAVWILIAAAAEKKKIFSWPAVFFLLMVLCTTFSAFRAVKYPDMNWPSYAARLRTESYFRIPVTPHGWGIDVGDRSAGGEWLKAVTT